MGTPGVTFTFMNGTRADADQVNTNFQDLLAALTDGSKELVVKSVTADVVTATTMSFQYESAQDYLLVGRNTPTPWHPDWAAIQLGAVAGLGSQKDFVLGASSYDIVRNAYLAADGNWRQQEDGPSERIQMAGGQILMYHTVGGTAGDIIVWSPSTTINGLGTQNRLTRFTNVEGNHIGDSAVEDDGAQINILNRMLKIESPGDTAKISFSQYDDVMLDRDSTAFKIYNNLSYNDIRLGGGNLNRHFVLSRDFVTQPYGDYPATMLGSIGPTSLAAGAINFGGIEFIGIANGYCTASNSAISLKALHGQTFMMTPSIVLSGAKNDGANSPTEIGNTEYLLLIKNHETPKLYMDGMGRIGVGLNNFNAGAMFDYRAPTTGSVPLLNLRGEAYAHGMTSLIDIPADGFFTLYAPGGPAGGGAYFKAIGDHFAGSSPFTFDATTLESYPNPQRANFQFYSSEKDGTSRKRLSDGGIHLSFSDLNEYVMYLNTVDSSQLNYALYMRPWIQAFPVDDPGAVPNNGGIKTVTISMDDQSERDIMSLLRSSAQKEFVGLINVAFKGATNGSAIYNVEAGGASHTGVTLVAGDAAKFEANQAFTTSGKINVYRWDNSPRIYNYTGGAITLVITVIGILDA